MSALVVEVAGHTDETEAELERALAHHVALVAFYSGTCQICKQQNALFDEMASFYGDLVAATRVDAIHHPELAERFAVDGLPTAVILVDGVQRRQLKGCVHRVHYELALNPIFGPEVELGASRRTGAESTPIPAGLLAVRCAPRDI